MIQRDSTPHPSPSQGLGITQTNKRGMRPIDAAKSSPVSPRRSQVACTALRTSISDDRGHPDLVILAFSRGFAGRSPSILVYYPHYWCALRIELQGGERGETAVRVLTKHGNSSNLPNSCFSAQTFAKGCQSPCRRLVTT